MKTEKELQTQTTSVAPKKYLRINGLKMAYTEAGTGSPIIFLHGNPTSSYIWRNIIPLVQDFGCCIAPDLMGMGDSDRLNDPEEYTYGTYKMFLDEFLNGLDIQKDIIFVVHDWGSVLAFDWARNHPDKVKGIVYMEAITMPRTWDEVPGPARETFQKLRSEEGEKMIIFENSFIEFNLPKSVLRPLSEAEMAEYRRPFTDPGESRRPMLSWARQLPIGGEPAEIIKIVNDNTRWLSESSIPKLFIEARPGTLSKAEKENCTHWPNQTHVTVVGHHNLQEDSAADIGMAMAQWLRML
ncbi:haloalkane dehalogenase [Dyadobacter tibetensis]|uniref:haloalkane dehalogenase n=1 Tax=Dyadobacter tibetensis TaxID=1211851 RepID=UPI0004706FF0|nr:haloalkane dehalogenase [Dyadobacter tibetensis]